MNSQVLLRGKLIWMDHVKLCKCLISKNHFVMYNKYYYYFLIIAIGMTNDDNAKLVYIGKKHFNFGRNGRQKETVELSDAFKNYLENKKMLDKGHLERSLRRNVYNFNLILAVIKGQK